MRATAVSPRGFAAKAFSGTHTVTIALNCPEERRSGLLGFAFQRETAGAPGAPKWLRSQKVFKSIVPAPAAAHDEQPPRRFYTNEFPVQSFLWGDYAASPGTTYRFRIQPMYGQPGALVTDPDDELKIEITTEKEWADGEVHGVWFNRGAIASQKFAEEFGNKPPTNINDPTDPEVKWLSRGLLEACLAYIDGTPPGDALRVAAYEFTYPPVLDAFKRALDRGVDVKIVYHDTTADKGANEQAMQAAGLPVNDQVITFHRSKTKIPHNKFIVRLQGGTAPVEVWTGSTNFTPSGFLGQTNVGHRVADAETARQYLKFWELVKADPDSADARAGVMALTPDPAEVIAEKSIVRLFSPRTKADMLGWYGRRMLDCANSLWFTAAFGVTAKLVDPIAQARDQMRFVLMEKPAAADVKAKLTQDLTHVILSYGIPLGEIYADKDGKPTARKRIKEFELDKWFFMEELYRPKNDGFVFFVHTKFLLIDPLSDDPLVCSGSANFSSGSLLQNDENMLLIRGNTRVADIYMTEFDRIFRHFYFRNIANELAGKGNDAAAAFLDETSAWTDSYFEPNHIKTNRRLMFFDQAKTTWFARASAGPGEPTEKPPATRRKKAGSKTGVKTGGRTAGSAPAKKAGAKKKAVKKKAAKKAVKRSATKKTAKRPAAKATRTKGTKRKTATARKRVTRTPARSKTGKTAGTKARRPRR